MLVVCRSYAAMFFSVAVSKRFGRADENFSAKESVGEILNNNISAFALEILQGAPSPPLPPKKL